MVFLARPRRAAPANAAVTAASAAAPAHPTWLRGGEDGGFCVRGELAAPPAGDAAHGGSEPLRRAAPFAALSHALFGRIASGPVFELAAKVASPAKRSAPVEHFSVVRVRGDGRCMFRALALGLAALKGIVLSSAQEEREADLLRNAVQEAICASVVTREKYPDAVFSIKSEMPIPTYCQRITSSSFWGGESELLVLVTMLKVPVAVYLPQGSGAYPTGFARLVTYGEKFAKTKSGKERQPVKLLFNGSNHYDLLL